MAEEMNPKMLKDVEIKAIEICAKSLHRASVYLLAGNLSAAKDEWKAALEAIALSQRAGIEFEDAPIPDNVIPLKRKH